MRNAFAAEITKLAQLDGRIVLLSGDIGNRLFNDYKRHCPTQFYNCGAAEANMISMAAGMALCGFHPVAYTITSFITARCLEQIRLDICYHNVPVVIVGVGSGLSYASLNATHHSCEDIAFLRVIPNMTVICPGDAHEVRLALQAAFRHNGPVYIRMGKKNEPLVHPEAPSFTIGKGIVIRNGDDICLLATGTVLPMVVEASNILLNRGVSCRVVSFHTVKPLDCDMLADVFSCFKTVVTVEEHSILAGFGSSVAEWLADYPHRNSRLLRIGTSDEFLYTAGDEVCARKQYGLTPEAIANRVCQTLEVDQVA
jgi:transketolase